MKSFVLSLVFVPTLLAAQLAEPRQVPLDEAVRLARRNAPATVQARNSIRTSAATVRTRYSAFLPSLSFGAGVGRQDGTRFIADLNQVISTDQPWRGGHGFSSSIQLFNGGRRFFELRAAQANVDAAEATETSQSYAVALRVKQEYFAILAARESEAAARKQLETSEQQLRVAGARVSAGAASLSDSLRSSISVGNARIAIREAQNQLAAANARLSRLTGTGDLITAVAADTGVVDRISLSDEELYALAESGPEVRRAEASVRAAKQSSRAARTTYLPTVSASMGWNFAANDTGFRFTGDTRNRNISTNLSISLPLFQGLGREEQVVATNVTRDNAEVLLRDTRMSQRENLTTFLGNFRTAELRVEIQQAAVRAAELDLRVMQERYGIGSVTLIELLQSQTTLDQARQALIQARVQARTAKAQVEQLIGRDL